MTLTLIAALAAMLLVMTSLLAYVVAQNTGPRARVRMRIAAVAGAKGGSGGGASKKAGANQPQRRQRQIMSKLAEAAGGEEGAKPSRRVELRLLLDRAGLSMSVRNFYIVSAVSAAVFTAGYLLFGFQLFIFKIIPVILLVPVLGGIGVPRWILKQATARRQKHFTQHFADALDVIVRGIRSGLPVGECFNIIAREGAPPVCDEFKLLVEGQKLGMTLKQALERSCRRMPTADVKFFAIVLNLQQQTGGNLAETLAGLSDVLRQRKKMADKVKAMSSEARMTASIIGSMPFLIGGMIGLINPDYIMLLFTDPTGLKITYFGGFWMLCGIFIMKQMVSFEI
jgi:tight adherence protein B